MNKEFFENANEINEAAWLRDGKNDRKHFATNFSKIIKTIKRAILQMLK
jgi:hypothetical protein